MKKRWICLLVENEIGVLAKISGLFSGKSYNLNSLTVGVTEDISISRMTISLTSDDKTFEQVKKQLNRSVEVIKVIDYTDTAIHRKELMFTRINNCTDKDMEEITRLSGIFRLKIIDYNRTSILLESTHTEKQNDDVLNLLKTYYPNRVEITRGGVVAVEALNVTG